MNDNAVLSSDFAKGIIKELYELFKKPNRTIEEQKSFLQILKYIPVNPSDVKEDCSHEIKGSVFYTLSIGRISGRTNAYLNR